MTKERFDELVSAEYERYIERGEVWLAARFEEEIYDMWIASRGTLEYEDGAWYVPIS